MNSGVEAVRELLESVLDLFELDATLDIETTEERVRVTIDGEDLGVLIGHHGTTIDALEHLAQRAFHHAADEDVTMYLTLDIQNYRKRREFALQRIAARAASEAVRIHQPVDLDPMRRFERKVVTAFLRDRPDVYTRTEGEEPFRMVTVFPRNWEPS